MTTWTRIFFDDLPADADIDRQKWESPVYSADHNPAYIPRTDFRNRVDIQGPIGAVPCTSQNGADLRCANRVDANETVIESDTVALAVRKLVSEGAWSAGTPAELLAGFAKSKEAAAQGVNWGGTASELLEALGKQVGETASQTKTWPKTPRALSGRLRRAAPNLRRVGIAITFDREGHMRSRVITIAATVADEAGTQPSAPAASSAETKTGGQGNSLDANDLRTRNGAADANTIPTAATVRPTVRSNPLKPEDEDTAAAADAKIHHFSDGEHDDPAWWGRI